MDNNKLYSETGYYASQVRRGAERRQRLTLIASVLLHLSILAALELPLFFGGEPPREIQPRQVINIFVPHRQETPPEPKPDTPVAPAEVPVRIAGVEAAPDEASIAIDPTKVDPTKAELTYDDPGKELQEVLRIYRGQIGFALPKDQGHYLKRVFNVTDQRETTSPNDLISMAEYWPIKINGAGYPLVDLLRKQYHLETYVAYALLSEVFANELYRALKRKSPAIGEIASAHVVIASGSAAGFVVTKVQMNGSVH